MDRVYDANVLRHWPGGIVPYKFISTTFTKIAKDVIAQAIAHIEQNSCIQIRPATPSDYVSTAVHEFLHILGASHEQTRPDRDDFVFINWTNIESGKEHNFFKTRSPTTPASVPICNSGPTSSGPDFFGCTTSSVTDTYGFDYDYQSVMHYSKTAFAVSNSVQTITPIPTASVTVGNNVGMSPLDISKLNAAYNCPNRSPSSSCDMSLIGTMGTLDQSTAMDGCEIFITVPVGHTIEFFFTDFNSPFRSQLRIQIQRLDIQRELRCRRDNLTLLGIGNTSLRFCGTLNNQLTYISNRNFAKFIFNSDRGVQAAGFRAVIEGKPFI
ncbi:hypothetical protein TCAL_15287 [Tigriopus californicus]|uniref:Metalloendopeptidase n=1 Tax=Tigriopus californicus TaxID=6832 RepID=A0A553PLZ9_TIGCA|nr:hypothetical protein TCAL_15287 [Tigriopus californicus]